MMLDAFNHILFVFGAVLSASYLVLSVIAAFTLRKYILQNRNISTDFLLSSSLSPSVSLIAPAYNEEKTVVENVRSLLLLHYNKYEVIVVNDGSTDQTLDLLINAYDLKKVYYVTPPFISSQKIIAVYKSNNKAFKKLVVVDKENGGKADALNAGINVSSNELITCMDVDCIVHQQALLKLVKPFMEETKQVIACGGVIRIANSCVVKDGELVKAIVPSKRIARFQVIEYLRAFLIGRIAWGRINGLMLVSGALGVFDKSIVIACGGYNTKTVGEDMELVVRMRKYMAQHKRQHKVVYLPDPLCWTEAPSEYAILERQRNRWMRGTIETLWMHKTMLFNPRYGIIGLLSYPYWFFFEWLAPIIELVGYLYVFYLIISGYQGWDIYLLLFAAVYAFSQMITILAIVFEEITYNQYKKPGDIVKLLLTSLLEPIIYHPLTVLWSIKGNIDKMRGIKKWGEMKRTVFN
jgi:poly-beta-1,6-N-acetyl-D-glucosamine synthase